MNEQQMEAVEKLVESGIFPKGLIAITETPCGRPRAYVFITRECRKRTVLDDVFESIRDDGDSDDEGEEWKYAKIS